MLSLNKQNGGFMGKKNISKKINKKNAVLDMSSRKNMNIIYGKEYTDEELAALISDLKKQMEQMEDIYQKYYSQNSYIDRINERNFTNILQAKLFSIISKIISFSNTET